MSDERALYVRRLLSRFLPELKNPRARVVIQAWELRSAGITPAQIIERLGGRWEAEHNERQDYYVFRRPRALRELTMVLDEPEGRWMDRRASA
jgi:hypothetical protein